MELYLKNKILGNFILLIKDNKIEFLIIKNKIINT